MSPLRPCIDCGAPTRPPVSGSPGRRRGVGVRLVSPTAWRTNRRSIVRLAGSGWRRLAVDASGSSRITPVVGVQATLPSSPSPDQLPVSSRSCTWSHAFRRAAISTIVRPVAIAQADVRPPTTGHEAGSASKGVFAGAGDAY